MPPATGHTAPPEGAALPRVSVLLLNWNQWDETLECMESVFRMDYPAFRVVVCDNGSADGSVERFVAWAAGGEGAPAAAAAPAGAGTGPVARPISCAVVAREEAERGGGGDARLVVVRNGGNLGFAAGNNPGLRLALARGDDYVWVLNNDTVVARDALSQLVAAAQADPGVGMVGAKLLFYDEPDVVQAAGGGSLTRWNGMTALYGYGETDAGQWDRAWEPQYVHGASLLVRAEVGRTVGLMDERYFIYSEEVDWCLRTRAAGWRLGYAHRARVWHKEGRSGVSSGGVMQDYHGLRGRLLLVRTHNPRFLPLAVAHSVYRTLLPKVVRRQPERLRAVLRAYRDEFRAMRGARRG